MTATSHRAGGLITVDWIIIALSVFALFLLLATTIRTDPMRLGAASETSEGLRILTPEERLVAFEDFSAGPHGWATGSASTAQAATPGVLGPFTTGEVEKTYRLPAEARRVVLTIDLYLSSEAAAAGLRVDLDGVTLLRGLSVAEARAETVTLTPPDARGPGNPWRLRVDMAEPASTLTLGVSRPEGEGLWGLDTIWVVAEAPTRAS